jgi:hypothetical protein
VSRADVSRMKWPHLEVMLALARPEIGMRFHEMFSTWFKITAVAPEAVEMCQYDYDKEEWTRPETKTREEWMERFAYKSIPGFWVRLA